MSNQQDQPAEQPKLRSRGRKRAPVKPGTRPAKATNKHSGGRPGFVPSNSEREFVKTMCGMRMSVAEIAKVIGFGRRDPTNNKSGRPISKKCLYKHFRDELAGGRSLLRAEIAGRFRAALADGQRWAIEAGLRSQFGWDPNRFGGLIGPPDDGEAVQPTIAVEFVIPGYGSSKIEPEPAPVPGQRLLPAPVQRIHTPFGTVDWEHDPPARPPGPRYDGSRATNPACSNLVPRAPTGWQNEPLPALVAVPPGLLYGLGTAQIDGRDCKNRTAVRG